MWANDSFRAPPVAPTNSSIWDVKDPSRPLPYSFQTPTPIAPPPVAGVAFVTQARAVRPKKPKVKQTRPRVLRALHPSSRSDPYGPSSSPIFVSSELQPSFPHLAPPSPPIDYPEPPSPVPVDEEVAVDDLPYASSVSGSEQAYGYERDESSPERSLFSPLRTGSPCTSVATPPCSPPLRPWSSPSGACLSPLMLGASLSMGDAAKSTPFVVRARSDPPVTSSQSRGEVAPSVYEACHQRRLPPMNFKKLAAASSGLDLPPMGIGLVLPPLHDSSASDRYDSADEGRDFDASSQTQPTARHAPYHIPNGPRSLCKESRTDLPPLRLLLGQLEVDEQQRAQSESQSQSHSQSSATLANKLLILQALARKRGAPTIPHQPSRGIAKKVECAAPTVPALRPRPIALARPTRAPACYLGQFKLGTGSGPGVTVTRVAGNRSAAAVHPQRGGLHAL